MKDDQGVPVEGVALHIGKQVAYTDSAGRFMARFSKRGALPLSLAPDESIHNGAYEVVSVPAEAKAETEENSCDLQVVVRASSASAKCAAAAVMFHRSIVKSTEMRPRFRALCPATAHSTAMCCSARPSQLKSSSQPAAPSERR